MFQFSTHLTTPETLTSSPVTPQENLGGSARLWTLRDIREMPDLREEMSLAIRDTCNILVCFQDQLAKKYLWCELGDSFLGC